MLLLQNFLILLDFVFKGASVTFWPNFVTFSFFSLYFPFSKHETTSFYAVAVS